MKPLLEDHRILMRYQYAKTHSFRPSIKVYSKRSMKHNSTNKVFKSSRVVPQVGLEKVFNHPSWR